MTELTETNVPPRPAEAPKFRRAAEVLGGPAVLNREVDTPLDAHEMLLRGLPGAVLTRLAEGLDPSSLEKAVGISWRTFQRRKADPAGRLSREQSGRAWKFAEILAKATAVFGSRAEAERWLERPAIGLDRHRPIDLLATAAGIEIVENHLERIEYGVYT